MVESLRFPTVFSSILIFLRMTITQKILRFFLKKGKLTYIDDFNYY